MTYRLLILITVLLISCDTPAGDTNTDDHSPEIVSSIGIIEVDENAASKTFDLSKVFVDKDGDPITVEIVSNTNGDLVTLSLNEKVLTIEFAKDKFGEAEIVVKATAKEKSVTEKFTIKVKGSAATISHTKAIDAFTKKSFSEAETAFKALVSSGDQRYLEVAYTGLGYTQINLDKDEDAYTSFSEGLAKLNSSNQIKSGLVFLEYSLKENFEQAIKYGLGILSAEENFEMKLSKRVKGDDLRLTVAQSYFAMGWLKECLEQVKKLNPQFNVEESDEKFKEKLMNELRSLSDSLKNT